MTWFWKQVMYGGEDRLDTLLHRKGWSRQPLLNLRISLWRRLLRISRRKVARAR